MHGQISVQHGRKLHTPSTNYQILAAQQEPKKKKEKKKRGPNS